MRISSAFDGGNIVCRSCEAPDDIRLEIAKDCESDFLQWFYFRADGGVNTPCMMTIENAGNAAFPDGWKDYQAVASYDQEVWFRVPTQYRDKQLTIHHTPDHNVVYYAYFAPFSLDRHTKLVAGAQLSDIAHVESLGITLDGRDLDLITIGSHNDNKLSCWIIARQHPGETMAEWWMEGFINRILDPDDALSRLLLDKAVFYLIPNMNPDGSVRGHLRTNAAGVNLNREWNITSLEKSPEVFHALTAMRKTGVNFALDVHGDEALPYAFIAGAEGIPSYSDGDAIVLRKYKTALQKANPDFQTKMGYTENPPGSADLSKFAKFAGETFGCLAMTLEMPFKDNALMPDPKFGWSPERCRKLGAANLDAIFAVLDDLR